MTTDRFPWVHHHPNPAARWHIVALHGALRSATAFDRLKRAFVDACFTAVDLPGHGEARECPPNFLPSALATHICDGIAPVLQGLPIIVLAESFSGLAATAVASRLSSVEGVVMLDTPLDTANMRSSQQMLMDLYHKGDPTDRQWVGRLALEFFGMDCLTGAVAKRVYHDYIRESSAPTLMITGSRHADQDSAGAFFRDSDRAALANVKGFRLAVIEGMGHGVLREAPRDVAVLTAKFASQILGQRQG